MTRFSSPYISVIMPVYNAEKYLNAAIESVLNQTFADFEFIIVNDGSTDKSEELILSYKDERIVYVKNLTNLGLISTLNATIQLAKGKYIARMDNDDICLARRFDLQLQYLKIHPAAKVICSPVQFINAEGKEMGYWPADKNATSYAQIVNTLPWENCIAHPTVLIETDLLKKYEYSENQKGSEDWDLWLRLVRDNIHIVKTTEVLLKYRVHSNSFTRLYNNSVSPQIKATVVKLKFVWSSLLLFRLNLFTLKTGFTIYKDLGYHIKIRTLPRLLKKMKWFFTISPIKAYSQYRLLKRSLLKYKSSRFLFFPYSHIGGAEKVHAEITKVAASQKPFVFITGIGDQGTYLKQFGNDCVLMPVAKALYHPLFSKRSEKLIIDKIQAVDKPLVFGCNNLFFYDLLPKLNQKIHVADLTHDYDYVRDKDFALNYLPNYLRCNQRVFISNAALKKTEDFYEDNFVGEFKDRLSLIYNYVNAPQVPIKRSEIVPYRILYVGRDTKEKRVDSIFELAQVCEKQKLPFEFVFVGPLRKRKNYNQLNTIKYEGVITDETKLSAIYAAAHFIIISSESEGFPLTLAEGMIHGCIPLSTAVGDIPFHIKHAVNGLLCYKTQAPELRDEFSSLLMEIIQNKYNLLSLSENARDYAQKHFSKEDFVSAYSKVLKLD